MKKYYVYKYVRQTGEIVYIGITSNLQRRFSQHEIEDPFYEPDNCSYLVYYFETPTLTDSKIWELLLINKYKPQFNVRDKETASLLPLFLSNYESEPQWEKFVYKERDFESKLEARWSYDYRQVYCSTTTDSKSIQKAKDSLSKSTAKLKKLRKKHKQLCKKEWA